MSRWANTGRLPYSRTPGGHLRIPRAAVMAYLADTAATTPATTNPENTT